MVGPIGLPYASAAAIAGLKNASDQLDRSADTMVASGAGESDTVTLSAGAKAAPGPDEVGALVDMRMARYNAAAQVSVLRTVDEVSSDLLGIVGRKPV